jgi:hypothetical protein
MKKRLGLFAFALAATAAALISGPAPAESACQPPACRNSPSCCIARECGAWCEGKGRPSCGGNGSGGCCACLRS